jgi:glycosyltransferase involved in cell wall biosynthesis
MKIGLVIYGSPDTMSGGYLYDRKLTSYLRSQGDEVILISLRLGAYVAHLIDNLSFRLPPVLDILIEDELVHPSVLTANHARGGKPRAAYPVVSLIHNLHSSERRAAWLNSVYRQIEKVHLESVDGFIFNSSATEDSVRRLVGHAKPAVIARPGADRLGSLSAEEVRGRAARLGTLRLLFVAAVTPLKGLDVLLDALVHLPEDSCSLDVVGSLQVDRAYSHQMQARAARLSVPVKFHGILDGEPLRARFQSADILVVPSYWEGFGIVFAEGMAFGLPAIGTSVGAIPDLISNGENGYLIEPGDRASLGEIILRIATDRRLLTRMSENALRRFASLPTWDQSAEVARRFLLQMTGR